MKSCYLLSFLLHALLLVGIVYHSQIKSPITQTLVVSLHGELPIQQAQVAQPSKSTVQKPKLNPSPPKLNPSPPKLNPSPPKLNQSPPKLDQLSNAFTNSSESADNSNTATPLENPSLLNDLNLLDPTQLENTNTPANLGIQSAGTTGESTGQLLDKALKDKEAYKQTLAQLVRRHWKISKREDFLQEVLLEISLDPTGRVNQIRLTQSSGDISIDKATERSVLLAAPFPAHPKSFPKNQDFVVILRFFPENLVLD